MTDYLDPRKWTEVTYCSHSLEEETTLDRVVTFLGRLQYEAIQAGLENVCFRFESRTEPYEDWLTNPVVEVFGFRKTTEKEAKEIERQDEIQRYADEKGITFYEASVVLRLLSEGRI